MTRSSRARAPVAYGSDTQKVKEILEAIAGEHPSVITDGSYPEPKVMFLGFGDSALNFELRCFDRRRIPCRRHRDPLSATRPAPAQLATGPAASFRTDQVSRLVESRLVAR